MKPKFSIVIPTRNRAHLLKHSLRSALNQTHEDYEVVVSDNHSSDGTAQMVMELKHPRVRYFRTDRTLAIPDSWEFALSKAKGEWVTFNCDDNAVSRRLLEWVENASSRYDSQVVSWTYADYFYETWEDPAWQNLIRIFTHTGEVIRVDSKTKLAWFFSNLLTDGTIPMMLNSCAHRSVIERVKEKAGRFFIPTCPDYSAGAATLAVVDHYAFINRPLVLGGTSKDSIGIASFRRGKPFWDSLREFDGQELLRHVPLRIITNVNCIADTLLRVKHAMPESFSSIELNWPNYFFRNVSQLAFTKSFGVDVSEDEAEVARVLSAQSFGLRARVVLKGFAKRLEPYHPRKIARAFLNSVQLLGKIESMMRHRPNKMACIYGKDAGFGNLSEALLYLENFTGNA